MPVWKRALCTLLFIGGGGAATVWGLYGLVAWIGALGRGDGVLETESFIVGIPLIGAGLCAIGTEFIIPRWVATWSDTGRTRFAAVALGSIGAGLLLVFLGQIVINVTMDLEGYHACDVGGRGRVIDVIWARKGVVCPRKDTDR